MAAIRYPTGAGASTLTALSDVTGSPGPNKSPVGDPAGELFTLTEIPTQESLDAILTSVAHVDWRPLQFADPRRFSAFGDGFADPAYRLTLNNVVHVQGMVACSPPLSDNDMGVLIATLDPDARPLATVLYGCPAYGNNARVDVLPDGTVTFGGMLTGGGQIDWLSLSVITFSVGAAQ